MSNMRVQNLVKPHLPQVKEQKLELADRKAPNDKLIEIDAYQPLVWEEGGPSYLQQLLAKSPSIKSHYENSLFRFQADRK